MVPERAVRDMAISLAKLSSRVFFTELLPTIYHMSFGDRKTVLKAIRVGVVKRNSKFYSRTDPMNTYVDRYRCTERKTFFDCVGTMTLHEFYVDYQPFFSDPINRSFLSSLIRQIPYADTTTAETQKENSILKEIGAATSGRKPSDINFMALFDDKPRSTAEYIKGRGSSRVASEIGFQLRKSKAVFKSKILFPRIGKKNKRLPKATIDSCESLTRSTYLDITSTVELEKLYMLFGIVIDGIDSLGTVWRPAVMVPRTFYRKGASSYNASRYIQQICNILLNFIRTVHTKIRFQVQGIPLSEEHILFIYDYSSFTSELKELHGFVLSLSQAFMGVKAKVLDTVEGIIEVDVGEILSIYAWECTTDVQVDASELLNMEEFIFHHDTGLLGVYGNISMSTLLHGIHLAIVLCGIDSGRCVGDDAIGSFLPEVLPKIELIQLLSMIGDLSEEKMEFWEYSNAVNADALSSWTYVKRPIDRFENHIVQGSLAIFPDLRLLYPEVIHIGQIGIPDCEEARCTLYIRAVINFVRHLESSKLGQDDLQMYSDILHVGYTRYGLSTFGGSKELSFSRYRMVYPSLLFDRSLERDFLSPYVLPGGTVVTFKVDHEALENPESLRVSSVFTARSDPFLRFLKRLDLVDEVYGLEEHTVESLFLAGDKRFLEIFDFRVRPKDLVCKYLILDVLPNWALDYISPLIGVES